MTCGPRRIFQNRRPPRPVHLLRPGGPRLRLPPPPGPGGPGSPDLGGLGGDPPAAKWMAEVKGAIDSTDTLHLRPCPTTPHKTLWSSSLTAEEAWSLSQVRLPVFASATRAQLLPNFCPSEVISQDLR
jgi:hypothetical protein